MTGNRRRIRLISYWALVGVLAAVCLAGLTLTLARVRVIRDSSTSMENTIMPGDDLVYQPGSPLRRGDLVLFLSRPAPRGPAGLIVRRVMGLPGDHVACCDAHGRLTVNGKPLRETYLFPGDAPSMLRFSATLRAGQAWLMGDHRSIADDSRFTGPAPMTDILGRITLINSAGALIAVHTPATFIADGLAPPDHRPVVPAGWLLTGFAALAVLVIVLIAGLVLLIRRRRGAARQPTASYA
jgi:signal peptidase I